MKIIITETQYNNLNKDNLQKFCHKIWDQQKKRREEPYLDDLIYDMTNIRQGSGSDFEILRPIWYEYNGGINFLYEKIKNEIQDKIFELNVGDISNLNTRIKVTRIDLFDGRPPYKDLDIFVEMDIMGTIDFEMYDEDEELIRVNDTIDAAYYEALSAYETGDFLNYLNDEVFKYFRKKLKKYQIPIEIEIDLKEF